MKIYTPGHPSILETYIMYGIISALSRNLMPDEQKQIRVSAKGLFYEIEYSEELQIDCSSLYDSVLKAYNSVRDVEKFQGVGLLGPLGFQNEEKVIEFVSQAATVKDISEVYSLVPRESSERESPCKLHERRLRTAQIPIAPMLGKYYSKHEASGVSIPKAMQYKICPLCLLFALEGLLKYSTIFQVLSERSTSWIYSQLKPSITCGADELNYLLIQNRLSKKAVARRAKFMNEIPEIVVSLLVFYVADSHVAMELSKLEPEFISYRLEVAGKAPAIRSYNTYNVKPLLEFISTIKSTNPEFESTIDALRINIDRCIDALTFLSISALVRDIDKFYNFLRLCSTYYGQKIKVRIPSEEEIHTAIKWFYK